MSVLRETGPQYHESGSRGPAMPLNCLAIWRPGWKCVELGGTSSCWKLGPERVTPGVRPGTTDGMTDWHIGWQRLPAQETLSDSYLFPFLRPALTPALCVEDFPGSGM
ncbi:hypothetical protein DPEC_G00226440 [Dallia pectoralis]|uniref:Uncharacterized protein n=1 Tax=Dallia pectoralis TaxID=75939 RepID=A0ACC2G0P7_DALPE|nr:hypothetical protein DPEC_G00226440 [Dallia pectoralis]